MKSGLSLGSGELIESRTDFAAVELFCGGETDLPTDILK